jgi:hypothetical protein
MVGVSVVGVFSPSFAAIDESAHKRTNDVASRRVRFALRSPNFCPRTPHTQRDSTPT